MDQAESGATTVLGDALAMDETEWEPPLIPDKRVKNTVQAYVNAKRRMRHSGGGVTRRYSISKSPENDTSVTA
jgi:hypothetical protein